MNEEDESGGSWTSLKRKLDERGGGGGKLDYEKQGTSLLVSMLMNSIHGLKKSMSAPPKAMVNVLPVVHLLIVHRQ